MKVLISRSSTNQVIGGAELSARDIARSLTSLGHTCLLVTNIKDPIMHRGLPMSSMRYSIWPRSSHSKITRTLYPIKMILLFFQYLAIVLEFKPDILCPQSREDQVVLTLIGKILNTPVIWRDPGDLAPQLQHTVHGFFQRLNRSLQVSAATKATHIFSLNEYDKEIITKSIPGLSPNKISVIGSNIMFEDYTVDKIGNKKGLTIGSVSRLDKHKGIQYLIDAFKETQNSHKGGLYLLIAGSGDYQQVLKNKAKNISNIVFLGHQNDVSNIFNQLDIFVQPAEFEGWGRNVKEAMLFGLPIIGSNVGGIKKQITHEVDGLLFNPGDTETLRNYIEKLSDNPSLRKELGKNAHKKALSEGDWILTVKNEILPLFEVYKR